MCFTSNGPTSKVCSCDHHAPSLKAIRSVLYNRAIAIELRDLTLSAEGIIDWAGLELTQYHKGKLIPSDFDMVDRDSADSLQIARFDNLWGGSDGRRFINRYLKRASGEFKNRLKITSVDSVAMLQFALSIHYCRTVGRCSRCMGSCENE